ncbi:MAG: succinylglutamate desuccinylase/aspartoacylase family protein [Bryobacterales bacterium]|nr:succinylglutamate desuccinylase/aspartoacylase family protein [Bryobacterales bacterium]
MRPHEFKLAGCAPGTKQRLWMELDNSSQEGLRIPLLVARGVRDGAVLAMTANIHGDEYEGVGAIFEFFDALDVAAMTGSVIAVPVANPPAYAAIARTSPLDGANLARVFPGKAGGTASEAIAHAIDTAVIGQASFFIDLHSAGVRYLMPTMAGFYTEDPRSRAAAEAFGAPVIWGHPVIPPGRTLSSCKDHGVPFLYTEATGAGRIKREDAEIFGRGLRNLARHLGILASAMEPSAPPVELYGDGNTDMGLETSKDGFFVPTVNFLEPVVKGTLVGKLVDLDGSLLEEYRAPVDGVVAMLRMTPSVRAGDPLFLFATMVEQKS